MKAPYAIVEEGLIVCVTDTPAVETETQTYKKISNKRKEELIAQGVREGKNLLNMIDILEYEGVK